jgi:GT2 family glycosyltransferase
VCLRSVLARVREAGLEPASTATVTVVDNASDVPVRVSAELAAGVRVVRNTENRGFAAACNQIARQGSAAAVLFLNPDVVLGPDSLRRAVNLLAAPGRERTGVVGIQLLDDEGRVTRTCARRPTAFRFLATLLRLPRLGRVMPRGHLLLDWDHRDSRAVDHVTGACYLVRRETYEALGGFDERFFVYYEDLDFSMRAADAGWEVWYLAEAAAVHRGGWTRGDARPARLAHDWRSRVLFARKHFGPLVAAIVGLITAIADPLIRVGAGLRRRSWDGGRDVMAVAGGWLRTRRQASRGRVAG